MNKKSLLYYIFSVFTFILFVLGLYLVYIAISSGQNLSIGVFFPVCFTSVIFAVCIFYYRLKRLAGRAFKPLMALFLCSVLGFTAIFTVFAGYIMSFDTGSLPESADLVIVLGCRTYGTQPSVSLRSRLDAAVEILEKYPDAFCIVAGGQGPDETVSEAYAMKLYLEEKGIAEERIYMEDKSSNTYENLVFSAKIIEEHSLRAEDVIIVTNEYHIPRALLLADRNGYANLYAAPAPTPAYVLAPGLTREFFAYIKSYVFDW